MKEKINSYIAVLCITIIGAGASLLIMHVASANASTLTTKFVSSETVSASK